MVPTEYYDEHGSIIDQHEWLKKIASPGIILSLEQISIVLEEGWGSLPSPTLSGPSTLYSGYSLEAVVCTRYVGYDLGFGGEGAPLIYETTVKAHIKALSGDGILETIELYRCPCSSRYEANNNHTEVINAFQYKNNYSSFPHPYTNIPDDPPEPPEEDFDYPPVAPKKRNGRSLLF